MSPTDPRLHPIADDPDDHRICDYEGSPYRRVFWEEADRSYEDATERLALRRLLPPSGRRIVEIGAGFGRLVDEYRGYEEIILLDYARSMLEDARDRLSRAFGTRGPRLRFVCADLYRLPFASQSLDTVVQVRVLHHVEQVPRAFAEVSRVLGAGGSYVLEYANKRNLKAIARYAMGRQQERPFDRDPHEFVELNWNFHPEYIYEALVQAGLAPRESMAVSHFRHAQLKARVPATALARADALIGRPLAPLALAPSQFQRAIRATGQATVDSLWRCPACGGEDVVESAKAVHCSSCGRDWPIVDGIHIFREGAVG